jgi:dTDP-4-dehydrorhamnose reductase
MRNLLITGGTGQLGIELLRQSWPADVHVHAPSRDEFDLARESSIQEIVDRVQWDCVINAAAYTAVDGAEDDAVDAFLANSLGPTWLADATAKAGIPLIHVSTDYVFSGDSAEPYLEDSVVSPIGVYGASKAAGEFAVRSINPRSVIVRTAWVLSAHRSNFLKTMLRLAADRDRLRVVADQRGCPTSAADLAAAIAIIAMRQIEDPDAPSGTYHFVNAGNASWHELAVEILGQSAALGGPSAEVEPIGTSEFPTRAPRPANSRLATGKIERDFGIVPRDWRSAVADIMAELRQTQALKEHTR